ncbi:MAG: TIGR04282 family arsenosugar biosynthesis glycosyltransferase [Gammaproteobacteria bacterium]|nr:TIGR04282 family arsenosugar biosynthesis glycosyltransferase [Gammaproteobacteria bacterium]
MLFPDARILVFAKAPVEGRVKTRLIPQLGSAAAAELHRLMTSHVIQTATASALCPVQVWCYPGASHEFFQEAARQFPVTLHQQQGENLGDKMFHAASHTLQTARQVLIIGSDCLQFTASHLQQAIEYLTRQDKRVVLTPAHDGGYVLIGMNQTDRRLFGNITWGTSKVLAQTRKALQQLGWDWHELPCLHDVDTEADLKDIAAYAPQYPWPPALNLLLQKILANL